MSKTRDDSEVNISQPWLSNYKYTRKVFVTKMHQGECSFIKSDLQKPTKFGLHTSTDSTQFPQRYRMRNSNHATRGMGLKAKIDCLLVRTTRLQRRHAQPFIGQFGTDTQTIEVVRRTPLAPSFARMQSRDLAACASRCARISCMILQATHYKYMLFITSTAVNPSIELLHFKSVYFSSNENNEVSNIEH